MKWPKRIDFIEEMPRDPSGKLLKRRLRDPSGRTGVRPSDRPPGPGPCPGDPCPRAAGPGRQAGPWLAGLSPGRGSWPCWRGSPTAAGAWRATALPQLSASCQVPSARFSGGSAAKPSVPPGQTWRRPPLPGHPDRAAQPAGEDGVGPHPHHVTAGRVVRQPADVGGAAETAGHLDDVRGIVLVAGHPDRRRPGPAAVGGEGQPADVAPVPLRVPGSRRRAAGGRGSIEPLIHHSRPRGRRPGPTSCTGDDQVTPPSAEVVNRAVPRSEGERGRVGHRVVLVLQVDPPVRLHQQRRAVRPAVGEPRADRGHPAPGHPEIGGFLQHDVEVAGLEAQPPPCLVQI